MAEQYTQVDGQDLAPNVYVDPATGLPIPIYVHLTPASVGSGGGTSGGATETTLQSVRTRLDGTLDVTFAFKQYAPTFSRVTTIGTVAPGFEQVSVSNVGAANGILLGSTLKPGETVEYVAPIRGSLSSMVYDATGTEFVIVTLTRVETVG